MYICYLNFRYTDLENIVSFSIWKQIILFINVTAAFLCWYLYIPVREALQTLHRPICIHSRHISPSISNIQSYYTCQCLSLSCLYSPARVSTIIYKTINQKWSVRKGYHNAQIGSNVMSVSVQNLDQNKTHKAEVNVTGAITVVLPTNVTGVRYITFLSLTSSFSSSSDTILNNY